MIGARLGPWLLDREIGRGGMATVYLAHADAPHADPPPPRGGQGGGPSVVAVKVLAPELAAEQGFVLRFEREIEIVRRLNHPNIVRFFDSGVHDGRPWFAMEYVAGPSFDAVLEERGRLPWREVLEIACQVAPALKHAHDRGVIHRDLKPSNLLRRPPRQPCPTRGGRPRRRQARRLRRRQPLRRPTPHRHRRRRGHGRIPVARTGGRQAVTARSDLYSLGVVLYTLLIGRPPFEGEIMDLLHKHRYAHFDAPIHFVPEMPADFNVILRVNGERAGQTADRRRGAVPPTRHHPAQGDPSGVRADRRRRGSPLDTRTAPRGSKGQAGPATLMSRLMRRELERQNHGGPARRLLNRPVVLLTLLAVVIGLIVWGFWPPSEDQLYRRAEAAAASSNPDDWDRAAEYLDELDRDHPKHGRQSQVSDLRRKWRNTPRRNRRNTRPERRGR